jgi:hypothetical protein
MNPNMTTEQLYKMNKMCSGVGVRIPNYKPVIDWFKQNDYNLKKVCGGCGKLHKSSDTKLFRCGGCKNIYYCSKACQTKDWGEHKLLCKSLARDPNDKSMKKEWEKRMTSAIHHYNNPRKSLINNEGTIWAFLEADVGDHKLTMDKNHKWSYYCQLITIDELIEMNEMDKPTADFHRQKHNEGGIIFCWRGFAGSIG